MFERFESLVRRVAQYTEEPVTESDTHSFIERAVHDALPQKVRKLFDDSHYAESTFEAFKFFDRKISDFSGIKESGQKLMMAALAESGPIKLNTLQSDSDKDEQSGFRFMFAGAVSAVRNPRGHEYSQFDSAETCLDHLSLVSLLMRRLEDAGYSFD